MLFLYLRIIYGRISQAININYIWRRLIVKEIMALSNGSSLESLIP